MKNLEIPLFWAHGTEDAVIKSVAPSDPLSYD